MGSFDIRSKRRIQTWKKAALHFSLCFVTGFFTGFAPTSTASLFSGPTNPHRSVKDLGISAKPAESLQKSVDEHRSLMSKIPLTDPRKQPLPLADDDIIEDPPRDLLIVITTLEPGDRFQVAFLMRLAHTLRLASSPLLWIVVGTHSAAPTTADVLRRTGIMYRHLTYVENFADADVEADHRRNVALNHIESHRLDGIVHFADVSNVYDLEFFEEIREIEVFGTWPMVTVSVNKNRVVVEGPVCISSKVVGWQSKESSNNETVDTRTSLRSLGTNNGTAETKPPRINISGFAFNSSILWDPERWGRASSVHDTSQDSVKFVQEVVLEDKSKLRAIPPDCSKIMLWHLHIPRDLTLNSSSHIQNKR